MDKKAPRNLGAHYNRELDILKALQPLFLDELGEELERCKPSPKRLEEFRKKLAGIRALDPACGCGNTLVIAYGETRLLELDVLRELRKNQLTQVLDVSHLIYLDVDQFLRDRNRGVFRADRPSRALVDRPPDGPLVVRRSATLIFDHHVWLCLQ
jgi:hypothetical protein